jgi:hypothetical protein
MLMITFDYLCNIVIIILTSIANALIIIKNFLRRFQLPETPDQQLVRYQTRRSELLAQRDEISRQITDLDIAIQDIHRSVSSEQRALPQRTFTSLSPIRTSGHGISHNTTPRSERRPRIRHPSIGIPYPLPFNPPRTPEEERRNSIIVWVNELRARNNMQDGH